MTTITDIAKNTYTLTFNQEADYNWLKIVQVFATSESIETDLTNKKLINQNETREQIDYWQDLFFMEVAEYEKDMILDAPLLEKIKANPLFKTNKKFIEQLPKSSIKPGRQSLIESLIENENADALIPDNIVGTALKKKSRDDLRKDFKDWDKEANSKKKGLGYIKFLVAASLVGIMVTVGYNLLFNNSYDFDNSQFVSTTEKVIIRGNGLGFVNDKEELSITIQILDYNKVTSADQSNSKKLTINSYSYANKKLRLVLEDSPNTIELIEFEQNQFYIKVNNDFYEIEISKSFKKLHKLNDPETIEKLQQILFENE